MLPEAVPPELRFRYQRPLGPLVNPAFLDSNDSTFGQDEHGFTPNGPQTSGNLPDRRAFDVTSRGASGMGVSGQPTLSEPSSGEPSAAAGKLLTRGDMPPPSSSTGEGLAVPAKSPPPGASSPPPNPPNASPAAAESSPVSSSIGPQKDTAKSPQSLAGEVVKRMSERKSPGEPKSNWAQRLGLAVLSMTRLAPVANSLVHPKWTEQAHAYEAGMKNDEAQLNALEKAANVEGLSEQRAGNKLWNESRAEEVASRPELKQRQLQDTANAKDLDRKQKEEAAIIGKRKVYVLQNGETPPAGWDTMHSLVNPNMVFALSPRWEKLTDDMIPFAGGRTPGQTVDAEEFARIQELMGKSKLAQEKPPGAVTPERQFIDNYLGTHPGSQIGEAIEAFGKLKPAPQQNPPQALMIDPQGTAQLIRPGSHVAQGSVTPSGESTLNVPTAATRTMAETAPRVINFIDRMNKILDENAGKFGPLASRWKEFTTGKIGIPGKGYTQLRTVSGLLQTALMRMHVGARGGKEIMEHFGELIGSSHQSEENLRDALHEIKAYAEEVVREGRAPNNDTQGQQQQGVPSVGGTFNGGKVLKVTPIPQGQ